MIQFSNWHRMLSCAQTIGHSILKNDSFKTNSKFRIPAILGFFALCSLLFTSCDNNEVDTNTETQEEVATQQFVLKSDPFDPITINTTSSEYSGKKNRATKAGGDDNGRYNITFRYLVPPTERQVEVFEAAAARWERIIIKDEISVEGPIPSRFEGVPDIEGTIDDIVIEVVLAPIDGPGMILGQAGPTFVRTNNFLSLTGVMFFDVADLAFLDELDLFEEVIVHEMGHVLGVGTLWNLEPFFPRTLRGGPDSNPFFLGKKANVFWNAEGGTGELPVGNFGGPGTALSHWRESVLGNELMTGFLNLGENPLSRITAGSIKDLGYGAASVGESYDLPKGAPGVDLEDLAEGSEMEGLHIASMEELLSPIGFVTTD